MISGYSGSGKGTVMNALMKKYGERYKLSVSATTRVPRAGEEHGREYFFTNEEGFQKLLAQGKIIEHRAYDTIHGLWRYFTVDDGQIDLSKDDYIDAELIVEDKKIECKDID